MSGFYFRALYQAHVPLIMPCYALFAGFLSGFVVLFVL
jgi:hypothetical protein